MLDRLQESVKSEGLQDQVHVAPVGCLRLCSQGPLVAVDPEGALYERVKPEDAQSIVGAVNGGKATAERIDPRNPFFALQASVVLKNCGRIEPERIETYIAAGGYQPLHRALFEMSPAEAIDAVTRSGLRGRGGAGYPTGVEWATVAKHPGERKYVVCNADVAQ